MNFQPSTMQVLWTLPVRVKAVLSAICLLPLGGFVCLPMIWARIAREEISVTSMLADAVKDGHMEAAVFVRYSDMSLTLGMATAWQGYAKFFGVALMLLALVGIWFFILMWWGTEDRYVEERKVGSA